MQQQQQQHAGMQACIHASWCARLRPAPASPACSGCRPAALAPAPTMPCPGVLVLLLQFCVGHRRVLPHLQRPLLQRARCRGKQQGPRGAAGQPPGFGWLWCGPASLPWVLPVDALARPAVADAAVIVMCPFVPLCCADAGQAAVEPLHQQPHPAGGVQPLPHKPSRQLERVHRPLAAPL